MALNLIVKSHFLLLQDSLLGAKGVALAREVGKRVLLLNQFGLIGDPLLLDLSDLIFHIIDLLLNVVLLGLEWAGILIFTVLLLKLIELPVKSVDLVLLLRDCDVSLLDVTLEFLDLTLFLLELVDEVVKLLLKEFILRLGVKVIDADTRDLVSDVFYLDFLLGDLVVGNLGLLDEVGARFLNGLLLRSVVDDVVTDGLCLSVQLHNRLFKDLHLLVDVCLFNIHALGLLLSRLERGLKHYILLLKAFLVSFNFISALLQEVLLRLALLELLMKTLREFLLAAGLITDTSDLRFNLEDLIVLLLDQLLDSLESLISLLHTEEGLLPILEEGLLAHNDLLDFDGGFLEGVTGSSGLFLLRNKLSLIEGLLLV